MNTWDATNGRLRKALHLSLGQSHPYLLNPKFTGDGNQLLCMGSDPSQNSTTHEFTLWDVASGRQRSHHEAPNAGQYEIINIADDSRRMAYTPFSPAGEIRLWNT